MQATKPEVAGLTHTEPDLTGRYAVVTGGSRGIGSAVAIALANHGAEVAVSARSQQGLEMLLDHNRDLAPRLHPHVVDMSDGNQIDSFLEKILTERGHVDILVNNVGQSPLRTFLDMSDADWENLFRVNLLAAVHCARQLLPGMRAQKWGRVVMLGSGAARYPDVAFADYSASKAAIVSVSKSLARGYGRDNVLVNAVMPGLIRTEMSERAVGEIARATKTNPEPIFAELEQRVPLGRYGQPSEVADLVLFLVSERAAYINGAEIDIDGGLGDAIF